MTAIVAFDLGLQTTGVAYPGGSDIFECPAKHRSTPITTEKRNARRHWWIDTFRMILLPFPGCIVAVEAPVIGHANGNIETLRMHGWLDVAIADNGSTIHPANNKVLKKWATGNGNATKDDMLAAAIARGCIDPRTHDEADAYLLWCHVSEGAA